MQMNREAEQLSLFAQDGCAGKTCPAHSVPETPKGKTSGSSSRRLSESNAIPLMSLNLTPGHGNLLGESYWEMISPWRGGFLTLNTGASPKDAAASFLWQILQGSVLRKYYLSRTACLGILRRAQARGKELPPKLKQALEIQAGLTDLIGGPITPEAYHINQRNEDIDLHGVSGSLMATSNMQMQTFVTQASTGPLAAGFSAGAGASARTIGYSEHIAPTLKGSASGNCMPSILCLNDQGGSVMECSEDVSGTLRAQEHGHQPLVFDNHGQDTRFLGPVETAQTVSASFGMGGNNHPMVVNKQEPTLYENHGIDARYTGPHPVAPTMSARYGTGGNDVPLVEHPPVFCITGNAIDRQPQNGGNGIGYQTDIAYTLTATDHHAVFSRQRVDIFRENDVASTESARQYKDATDLILSADDRSMGAYLIRRLTPLECERLQGFPDGWTDLPGASDSARYKALGNSVAIPCVVYVMRGIAWASV